MTSHPICQICNKSFKLITATHLRSHGHTFESYRELFPNAQLVDSSHKDKLTARNKARKGSKATQETKDKMSESRTGKVQSQSTKDKIGLANKGKIRSQEAIDAWKISYTKAIKENDGKGFAVGERSKEFKDKMSEIAKARKPSEYKDKLTAMWDARTGMKLSDEQKEKYRVAQLNYIKNNPDAIKIKMWDTRPELEFEQELSKRGIRYEKQWHSSRPHFLYDFKINDNILVEIDGPYHYDAKIHGSEEKLEEQHIRDAAKNLAAGKNGCSIFRIPVTNHLPKNWLDILFKQGWTLFDK